MKRRTRTLDSTDRLFGCTSLSCIVWGVLMHLLGSKDRENKMQCNRASPNTRVSSRTKIINMIHWDKFAHSFLVPVKVLWHEYFIPLHFKIIPHPMDQDIVKGNLDSCRSMTSMNCNLLPCRFIMNKSGSGEQLHFAIESRQLDSKSGTQPRSIPYWAFWTDFEGAIIGGT